MSRNQPHEPQMLIGNQPTIEAEITALQHHIHDYRSALNDEGVWLFLATLGCWSVPNPILQFCALGLAAFLFGDRMAKRLTDKRTFSRLVKTIEERIAQSLPEEDSRKARLYDLAAFQKKELSTLTSLKGARTFFLCWLFFGASFAYTLLHMTPKTAG